jgi:hypothetical protein
MMARKKSKGLQEGARVRAGTQNPPTVTYFLCFVLGPTS